MSLPLLSLDNVTIRATTRLCFADTNWTINLDEQWALIGATGAGKSLFVSALCGRLPVVQGQIRYYFDDTPNSRSYLRSGEIVLVSAETQRELLQQYAGYHQARWQSTESAGVPTVADFLNWPTMEGHSPYKMNPPSLDESIYATRRAQAVELLGIGPLLNRKLIHLSHGEGRKVLLARALMQSPRLLILDDPFGGLDEASRKTLNAYLTAILESNQQRLLLVTSRPDEIPHGITHVLGIADYQVATQGEKAVIMASSFAKGVFKVEPRPAREDLMLPATDWPVLPPGAPLIELRHASVYYQEVTVLQDITWTMRQGEHWAIRGPNGAGKSTLLSLILADNPQAYTNELKIFGRRRGSGESIWDIKRQIGWVAPEIHMYYQSRATCQTIVCSGLFDSVGLYHNVTPAQLQSAAKWMQALGIETLAERSFQEVSIGEQRLVLLARALVKQPRLLILDEPCQGLDGLNRSRIIQLVDNLCQQTPVSLLYVTHHLDELPRSITHVMHLENGRMRVEKEW
jgi:molybdate transport system ATP-binding protein